MDVRCDPARATVQGRCWFRWKREAIRCKSFSRAPGIGGRRLDLAGRAFVGAHLTARKFAAVRRLMILQSNSLMRRILIATSNPGKLRDFAGAALRHGVEIAGIPGFSSLPTVVEDGLDVRRKRPQEGRELQPICSPGRSLWPTTPGLEIDALNGAPGVHSARYAAPDLHNKEPHEAEANTDDEANNARVLRELKNVPLDKRTGRFVCVLAAARDGKTLATFRGHRRRNHPRRSPRHERLRLRSAILLSADSKNIRRADRRRKIQVQPPRRGLPAISELV